MIAVILDCLVTLQLLKSKGVQKICHQQAIVERGLKCVQLVYGVAGKCLDYMVTFALTFLTFLLQE